MKRDIKKDILTAFDVLLIARGEVLDWTNIVLDRADGMRKKQELV